MKRIALTLAAALLLSITMAAQTTYNFQDINYPGDTFTQLLGINNSNVIAGYHGASINKGFTLVLPNKFTSENYPKSAQTQVTGINAAGDTVGFYITTNNVTEGFKKFGGTFTTTNFPDKPFNQLLGLNNVNQLVGYFSTTSSGSGPDFPTVFDIISSSMHISTQWVIQGATTAQATGINDAGMTCGFYVDAQQVTHGFIQQGANFTILNYPGGTSTSAFGINNSGLVVGTWTDASGASHGFVYTQSNGNWQSIDDPNGIGTTIVNGVNDNGVLVGFWGTSPLNTGFVATPQQ
jgi:probable HAF family extracellular repeat protein